MMGQGLLTQGQRRVLQAAAVAGAAVLAAGLFAGSRRAWASLLLCDFYFLSLAAVAGLFIAMHHLASAGWPTVLRRVPEAMTAYLPAGAALAVLLALGLGHLYHWTHPEGDPILAAKAAWLNPPGFILRGALILLLWTVLAALLVLRSRRQDRDGGVEHTRASVRLSGLFAVVFALTYTVASVDWIMSLEPHWYSTLFPWYVFSGALANACAVIAVLTVLLRRRGVLSGVNEAHLLDLGRYMFGFSAFWAYLWFSQYLLIWYSNIPEETAYFALRSHADWKAVFAANLPVNFVLPFFLLLSQQDKKSETRLLAAGAVLIAGRWLDLYQMVLPGVGLPALPGWADLCAFAATGALFLLLFDRAFRQAEPVPVSDPYLSESLHHHA